MDVTTADQAKIAENSGAVAVMALERIPADIREDGGVARMSSPRMIKEIQNTVSIPVMAKCRIGHILEAKILEALEVDFIDESEVLTPADNDNHIYKKEFTIPFVCGAKDLGEALRRIDEGAAMMRTKGEAGSGNIVEAVKHMRKITETIEELSEYNEDQLKEYSEQVHVPFLLVSEVAETKKLPVPNFSAGGIATPADAALMMHLGAQAVFVGSGIFKSADPINRAKAIVEATTYYDNPKKLSEISMDLKDAMEGIEISEIPKEKMLQNRGR
jgi:pyridoxal 5'-phosphate synthase pdxS subunit